MSAAAGGPLSVMTLVQRLDSLDVPEIAKVADQLSYSVAMELYEQLQRRLLEDGAPLKPAFEDES